LSREERIVLGQINKKTYLFLKYGNLMFFGIKMGV